MGMGSTFLVVSLPEGLQKDGADLLLAVGVLDHVRATRAALFPHNC